MISEFSVSPKPSNGKAKSFFAISLVAGAGAFALSFVMESFRWIPQLAAACLLIFAIFLYTRYMGQKLFYDVMLTSDGEPLFVVRQRIGKRESTMCRIGLWSITCIQREDGAARRGHKTPTGYAKYIYTPTFMPDVTYRIVTVSRHEKAEIVIECSDEMANTLLSYVAEARAGRTAEDEE